MDRYVCIHGHFYQPPRENPWLETIEVQDSAYPFHDWNERITDECYEPNGASRILDDDRRILEIVNNYGRINFNFGPTLLAWMEFAAPKSYAAILEADQLSMERFSGHGSAIAQAHSHLIMPLANRRDKETQIIWGIRDFESRFGRKPEGMWLPETAVDTETLELLAKHGITYTILAPHQAGMVREIGEDEWEDVNGGQVDPSRAYTAPLPSGNSIALFFYDGPISQGVAFEGLLSSGERYANRLVSGFSEERDSPQLAHVATDGETYGHHHRHGEMALSYAMRYIEEEELAKLTNYGEFLELHPPEYEAQIIEDTSWSCIHGVERWRSNCGCNTGGNPGWNQSWREPLRNSLDWLRDALEGPYEAAAGELFHDPWAARDAYIDVVLDRSTDSVDRFLEEHAKFELDDAQRVHALELLELQRHAMLMYTSCGWFFDELSGIETVQVIQYAGRAVQLAEHLFGDSFEEGFLERLAEARSNIPQQGDGRSIYDRYVRPAAVDLEKVVAHYVTSALFDDDMPPTVYCFSANPRRFYRQESGRAQLALGEMEIRSEITGESGVFSFCVLHLGDHNLDCGVRGYIDASTFDTMAAEVTEAFERADLPETIRLIDRHFAEHTYSLGTLFRDEQRRITDLILDGTLADAESVYRHLYDDHETLMRFLNSIHVPLPPALRTAAEFVMNVDVSRELARDDIDLEFVQSYFDDTSEWGLQLDITGLSFALEQTMERWSARLPDVDGEVEVLQRLRAMLDLESTLPFDVNLWTVQNDFYELLQSHLSTMQERAEDGDASAQEWVDEARSLGDALAILVL